jgi:cytochrome c oxidase subunit IV
MSDTAGQQHPIGIYLKVWLRDYTYLTRLTFFDRS